MAGLWKNAAAKKGLQPLLINEKQVEIHRESKQQGISERLPENLEESLPFVAESLQQFRLSLIPGMDGEVAKNDDQYRAPEHQVLNDILAQYPVKFRLCSCQCHNTLCIFVPKISFFIRNFQTLELVWRPLLEIKSVNFLMRQGAF